MSLLRIYVTAPRFLELKLNASKIQRTVGRMVTRAVKRRIRAGRGLRAGQDLRETGKLIRSIRYDRFHQDVRPSTRPRSDVSRRARSSFGLMRIHISGKYRRTGRQRRERTDPMGSKDLRFQIQVRQWLKATIRDDFEQRRAKIQGRLIRRNRIV